MHHDQAIPRLANSVSQAGYIRRDPEYAHMATGDRQ
jgi:hypothetical protein